MSALEYGWTSASRSICGSSCLGGASLAGGQIAIETNGMLSSAVGSRDHRAPIDQPLEARHQIMAKRSRGSTSRPGQRPPLQRQAARPAAAAAAAVPVVAPRPDTLTDAEEARAAELEASIVAEEKAAETARKRSTTPRSADAAPVRSTSSIEIAAAQEYAYVARDVKRIAIVGGGMILILLGIWLVLHITGVNVL